MIPSIGRTKPYGRSTSLRASHFRRAGHDGENAQAAREASANWTGEGISLHASWRAGHGRSDSRAGFGRERTAPSVAKALGLTQTKRFGCAHFSVFITDTNCTGVRS